MSISAPKSLIDELSPREYGEQRFTLALSESTPTPQVFQPVILTVDYSLCDPEGIVLPLQLVITGPSGAATQREHIFRRGAPAEITFTPLEGGSILVRLAEMFHNRWWGALELDVVGDPLDREGA